MDAHTPHASKALLDTRLAHETHRVATGLLVDATDRPGVPPEALEQLRDFLVANLRHHHEAEDAWLWPQVVAAAPGTRHALDGLSEEHARLDTALDRLADVVLTGAEHPDDARRAMREAAAEVRDSVRDHLDHEEPVLLPVLREHVTAAQWEEFSQRVVASAPQVAGHLQIGFFDEVGTPEEVASLLTDLPPQAQALLPDMRARAAADLRVLRGDGA